MIHVFVGTKAQYIKTAPLLRLMDARGVTYRLIDSGQHGAWSVGLRQQLGVRRPDHQLGDGRDVDRIPQAVLWAARLAVQLGDRRRLRRDVFADRPGICVVHGDTPSTLLSALMAKRAGLGVAHLEAGLRSEHLLHPFPEELIRVAVMRVADVLFAPDATAVANLRRMRVKGEIVPLPANTVVDALRAAMGDHPAQPDGSAPPQPDGAAPVRPGAAAGAAEVVITTHRVENLHRQSRLDGVVALAERIAATRPVVFVLHGPTAQALRARRLDRRLAAAGVRTTPLLPHHDFVRLLAAAPFVVTDGGSIQEECALLGVPTLLWRAATERADGVGANVVVSRYDPATVTAFVADPERHRHPTAHDRHVTVSEAPAPPASPSQVVLDHLLDRLAATAARRRVDDAPT